MNSLGQGSLEKPLDPRVAEYSVTEPMRREASGSKCKLLLLYIVKTQAGSNNSKRVWHRQDTIVILGQVWVLDRRTISRGLDKNGSPKT